MNEEILDNIENEIIRKPYFNWLEIAIAIAHFILVVFLFYNIYEVDFELENSLEELFLLVLSSISIFYIYQCRQQTIKQKRIFQIRSFVVLRILSIFNAAILLLISALAFPSFIDEFPKSSFDSEDFSFLFLFILFSFLGICQLYYAIFVHKLVLALQ